MTDLWTDRQVATLKNYARWGYSAGQASKIIGKSRNACIGKAARIGINFNCRKSSAQPPRPWTKEQDDKILDYVLAGKTAGEAAKLLKRSKSSVYTRANALNLKFQSPIVQNKITISKEQNVISKEQNVQGNVFSPNGCEPVSMVDLSDKCCRWPFDDEDGNHIGFCGGLATSNRYCELHAEIAFPAVARLADQKRAKEAA